MALRATLDLGTNTFHLLIVEVENGQIQSILVDEKRAVKIGAGGINQGFITEEAIQRAIVTFKEYKQIIEQYKEDLIVLTGGLSGTFSNILIPLQLGARDMASGFLNMLSYWFFFLSSVLM